MTQSDSMEEIIKQQKDNCVFCKIIDGKIPTNKVFEDNLVIGIMDINPSTEGHVLLMPKEHYPIMPIIPREVFCHLFKICKFMIRAIKEVVVCQRVSVFIANGGIAGQQSPHFMMHLIPRNDNDNLSFLDCIGNLNDDAEGLLDQLRPHIRSAIESFGERDSFTSKFLDPKGSVIEQKENNPVQNIPKSSSATAEQKQKISQLFNDNEEFRDLILNKVDDLKKLVVENEKWSVLFNGIDIDALSKKLKEMEGQ